MSGIRKINAVDTLPYNMPGNIMPTLIPTAFNTGDIRDCLEFADEDPEPHAWLGQDKTKGQSGVCPMYCFQQKRCRRENCTFYGRAETENFCSYCIERSWNAGNERRRSTDLDSPANAHTYIATPMCVKGTATPQPFCTLQVIQRTGITFPTIFKISLLVCLLLYSQ